MRKKKLAKLRPCAYCDRKTQMFKKIEVKPGIIMVMCYGCHKFAKEFLDKALEGGK